jgi:hypothetical protein
MTARAMTLMTARDAMDRAATVMTEGTSTTLISTMAATAMTTTAHPYPHYYPLVPDGKLLILGSRDANVMIATFHCSENV